MPDLDLIKQGEQGVRDRRGRLARVRSGNPAGRPRSPIAIALRQSRQWRVYADQVRARRLSASPASSTQVIMQGNFPWTALSTRERAARGGSKRRIWAGFRAEPLNRVPVSAGRGLRRLNR